MGKRYYCEYCDRAFLDNVSARKKHLASSLHQQQRDSWYDKFKSRQQKLEEQLKKPRVCRYYLQQGSCTFGPACRYRHMTDVEIERTRSEIKQDEFLKQRDSGNNVTVENWLKLNIKSKRKNAPTATNTPYSEEPQVIPEGLLSLPTIPPSLRPPPNEGRLQCDKIDWG